MFGILVSLTIGFTDQVVLEQNPALLDPKRDIKVLPWRRSVSSVPFDQLVGHRKYRTYTRPQSWEWTQPINEKTYISKATARRSSRLPWLVAEIARRNSSKSMLLSSFASNVSKANLSSERAQCRGGEPEMRAYFTCKSCRLCPGDRIACKLRRTSSCRVCR